MRECTHLFAWPGMAIALLLFAGCGTAQQEELQKTEDEQKHAQHKEQWFKDARGIASEEGFLLLDESVELPPPIDEGKRLPVNPYPVYTASQEAEPEPASEVPRLFFDDTVKYRVAFNFNKAEIADVVPVFAEALGVNYQLAPNLTGSVTLTLSEGMTRREIWELFKYVLHTAGIYVTTEHNLITLRNLDAASGESEFGDHPGSLELAVFRLKHIGTKEASAQLGQFFTKGAKALELENRNIVIVLDTKAAIAKLRSILTEVDQPLRHGWAKMVIPCRHIDAQRLAGELGEILPVLGFPVATGDKPQPEEIHLLAVERLQILVASAASREALDELGRWVGILDRADAGDQEKMYVYNIVNGNADELIKAISVMFPVDGTTLTPGSNSSGTTAQDAKIDTRTTGTAKDAPSSHLDVPVKIFADAVNERLLIRTKPKTYTMVKALLEKIDTIPAQVLLQVLIIDVVLNDSVKFGVEFMLQGQSGDTGMSGGTNYANLAPATGQKAQSGGNYYIFDSDNPENKYGYINALAGKTNIKVVSNPQILITSRCEAKISVGSKVPIVNSEITNTQSSNLSDTNLVRNIQYQDTGVILKVTPRITRGGRISIVMDQTVSEADQNSTSDIDSPIIKEQIINTTMSIRDGQTIICGGMIREKTSDTMSTLPIIGGVPFLRRLFGDSNIGSERTEMMILISGTIISENSQLESLLAKYQESVDTLIEFNLPPEERKRKLEQQKGLLETWFIE